MGDTEEVRNELEKLFYLVEDSSEKPVWKQNTGFALMQQISNSHKNSVHVNIFILSLQKLWMSDSSLLEADI